MFLGCASVFQDHTCGADQDDHICTAFDALSFTIFLLAILGCVLNPARLLYLTLRQHTRPMTDFFLSHYQAEANDAMKMLAFSIEARGYSAWYDQEVDQITPTAMLKGVSSTRYYTLHLSKGGLQRLFRGRAWR